MTNSCWYMVENFLWSISNDKKFEIHQNSNCNGAKRSLAWSRNPKSKDSSTQKNSEKILKMKNILAQKSKQCARKKK